MSSQALQLTDLSPAPAIVDLDAAVREAIGYHQAGRLADAEQLYRAIVDTPTGHPVASYGFGALCAEQGNIMEAISAYRHAIAMRPDFVDAHVNLGTALLALGLTEEAMDAYRRAIELNPENVTAHGNMAKALQDLGLVDQALAAYRTALTLQPDNAVISANLGGALLEAGACAESEAVTRRAIALWPNNAMAHANLGTALMRLDRHEEALAACRQAIRLGPDGAVMHASLGGAMLELGALSEAESLCRRAAALDPTLPDAQFNLSHALKAMNRLEEATLAAHRAIALRPDAAEYHFHLAHILLLRGDLDSGWIEYDARWRLPDFAWITSLHGVFSEPIWRGEDIRDKTILIYTEQGLGDIVLFARYLPLVVGKAGRVIVAAHPATCRLLRGIDGIEVISIRDVPLPPFDVHCPLLSLPRAFATRLDSIPATVPYLAADPADRARWASRIGGDRLRVGIVWAGNPSTKRDRFRSPGRAAIAPLFCVPGVDFIILQVGAGRADQQRESHPANVLDLGNEVADLADTAAIMAGLDLMISSCTAPLHLAGALGVRTWAMIPFAPYFPWLLERSDTPWYPSMRLYRQQQPGQDWSRVVDRIAADLTALVAAEPGRSRRPPALSHQRDARRTDACNELAPCQSGLMLFNRNDTYIGASLRKYGEFSGEEAELFRLIVQPGRTVLDVGANVGAHTVEMSHLVGPTGIVHAFEPQRLTFQLLCANVALNSCTNVFTHQAAAGAVSDTLIVPWLDPSQPNNYGGLSLLEAWPGEAVPMMTIDSLALRDCQFIKIDIEGMETAALHGAAATIGRCRPILYVENDRQAQSAPLISLIQSYGYRLYWHLPPLFRANNHRGDTENIFGSKVSVNMICIPAEISQSSLTNLREVTGPTDSVISW